MLSKVSNLNIAGLLIGLAMALAAVFSGWVAAVAPLVAVVLLAVGLALGGVVLAYASARRISPHDRQLAPFVLLFWAWALNVPAFVAFDPQGLQRPDLLNPQSGARIALFFIINLVLVVSLLASRRQPHGHGVSARRWVWLPGAIFFWYLLDAFMLLSGQDLLLALYRVAEWVTVLLLVSVLVERAPTDGANREAWLLKMAFAVMLFSLVVVFVLLPIAPNRVFQVGMTGFGRLGSPFAHPNVLGVLAGMAFFHFVSHASRMAFVGALVSIGVLLATFSRGAWIGFAVAGVVYLASARRTASARVMTLLALAVGVTLALGAYERFEDSILKFVSRGAAVENLATASERTAVWRAARVLIEEAPLLGHGFAAGPKKLNDVMAAGPTGTYFRALHAHNDFVQAQVSGGVIATFLLILLTARTLYLIIAVSKTASPRFSRVITAWTLQIWIHGLLTFLVSGPSAILGVLLIYLYACLETVRGFRQHDRRAALARRRP